MKLEQEIRYLIMRWREDQSDPNKPSRDGDQCADELESALERYGTGEEES